MNWYYADQGHETGPVDEVQLDELVRSGALPITALTWTDGMAEWKPYSDTRGARAVQPVNGPPALPFVYNPNVFCVSCRRFVPPHEAAFISGRLICPECQPVYVERLRESQFTTLPGALPYSGFWMRFVARMADYSILMIVETSFTVAVVGWTLTHRSDNPAQPIAALGITTLLGFLISGFYESYFLATRSATPGKMLCYIKVVRPSGAPIDTSIAITRYFARILSELTMSIGNVMAAFDSEKRALHDRVVGTRVIDVPPSGPAVATLWPVSRAICCGACQTSIPLESWNAYEPIPCPGCGTAVQAVVFPAITRSPAPGSPEAVQNEGEATCYYHASNRAKIACDECGRFLCAACDLDAGTKHLCPACLTLRMRNSQAQEFVPSVRLYDSIALTAALLPNLTVIGFFLTLFTAPAVVGFTLWNWKKPTSVTGRSKWRFVVAIIVAVFNVLFLFGSLAAALISAVRGKH